MSKLLQFKSSGQPFEIKSKTETKAEIIIYDSIGFDFWTGGGVTAKSFDAELKKLPSSINDLSIRINSPGGDVFEGMTIYNRIVQFKGKKTVYVDGLAASIASVIALAGDKIIMGEGAMFMVHKPWTMAMGNSNDLDATIDRLLTVEEQMVGIYLKKSKLDRNELKKMLADETWLDADQSLEAGFATEKSTETVAIAASILDKARWVKARPQFKHTETAQAKSAINELLAKVDNSLKK